ncbi:hypothetical protein SELMODRAFT_408503 [Selaginella moellendorffii]|uniref:Uncharacterized protein n=1 Tax=Selaginella moellendorffii TaxID=88036 RepID=D8R8I3_SELML|nr:hypothetical protein SELMODRAFT_408503 [Selaginella moellendorffii]
MKNEYGEWEKSSQPILKLHVLQFHLWDANHCIYGKKLESLKERYMQVFAKKAFTFRTACEREAQFRSYVFQALFGLLKSLSFSIQQMDMLMTTFLKGFKSIPAFIANLTLELFNKGTIG